MLRDTSSCSFFFFFESSMQKEMKLVEDEFYSILLVSMQSMNYPVLPPHTQKPRHIIFTISKNIYIYIN